MFERKVVKKARTLVWRMDPSNPTGQLVSPPRRNAKNAIAEEAHDGGLHASSLDLSNGADVVETEMNTLPGKLIDAFFKARR